MHMDNILRPDLAKNIDLSSKSDFSQLLLSDTLKAFDTKCATDRVAFSTDIQFLDVRGERKHLKQMKSIAAEHGSTWVPGLLYPRPDATGGRRSIEINLIADGRFQCAGYLRSKFSKLFYPTLIQHLESGRFVPVIGKVVGLGKSDGEIELMAFAKTDLVDFGVSYN